VGRDPTFSFDFCKLERGTQLKEGVASEDSANENTVRFQGFFNLNERAWVDNLVSSYNRRRAISYLADH
jgi:hypothetical protein